MTTAVVLASRVALAGLVGRETSTRLTLFLRVVTRLELSSLRLVEPIFGIACSSKQGI